VAAQAEQVWASFLAASPWTTAGGIGSNSEQDFPGWRSGRHVPVSAIQRKLRPSRRHSSSLGFKRIKTKLSFFLGSKSIDGNHSLGFQAYSGSDRESHALAKHKVDRTRGRRQFKVACSYISYVITFHVNCQNPNLV
jgi:hypothetical protein